MKKHWYILLILLVIQFYFLFNLQFTAWPEMFSFPFLRNNGFLLYKDMVHAYTPVLTMALSIAYGIFGYKLWVMQTFAWSMALVNSVIIFLIVAKTSNKKYLALLTTAFYIFTQPFLEGNMLWPDTAIVTPILLGTYLLLDKKIFWSGVFLTVAALIKQTAGLFLITGSVWLLIGKDRNKSILPWLIGPLLLGGTFLVRLLTENALLGFFKSTLINPSLFWTKFPGYVQMSLNQRELVILALLFLPAIFLVWKQKAKLFKKQEFLLIFLFLVSSLAAIYPRFSFFHFQASLAFIVILTGYLLGKTKIPNLFVASFLILLIVAIVIPTVKKDWGRETRFYGQKDLILGEIIRKNTPVGESVYLLGSHSANYTFAEVLPPKKWIDNFGWYFEVPGAQDKAISDWSQNPPGVIFWQEPEPGNWYDLGTYQPQKVTNWIEKNYTRGKEVQKGLWLWKIKS